MSKPHTVFGLWALYAAVACAQPSQGVAELTKTDADAVSPDADAQRRKASLRATLKSQFDGVGKRDATSVSLHELSARERADLRQQLRQQ